MLAPTGIAPRPIGVSSGSDTTDRPILTPNPESNDLLMSMVTALSAAAAAITAAAAIADAAAEAVSLQNTSGLLRLQLG